MAYVANQQRKTYNDDKVSADTPYEIATFQVNKPNRGGGQYPYALFKIQANWSSGSLLVNSELYVLQVININNQGDINVSYMPSPNPFYGGYPIYFELNPPQDINVAKYSHLLFGDVDPNIRNYFSIYLGIRDNGDPNYYESFIFVQSPNYNNGKLMTDSYCYILNTL